MSQDSPQSTKPEVLVSTTGVLGSSLVPEQGPEQGRVRPKVWIASNGTQCFSREEWIKFNQDLREM